MSVNVVWFPDYGHIVAGIFEYLSNREKDLQTVFFLGRGN